MWKDENLGYSHLYARKKIKKHITFFLIKKKLFCNVLDTSKYFSKIFINLYSIYPKHDTTGVEDKHVKVLQIEGLAVTQKIIIIIITSYDSYE